MNTEIPETPEWLNRSCEIVYNYMVEAICQKDIIGHTFFEIYSLLNKCCHLNYIAALVVVSYMEDLKMLKKVRTFDESESDFDEIVDNTFYVVKMI